MDYSQISSFLDKFKKLISSEELYRDTISQIISKEISYNLDTKNIKIKKGVIFINGSPALRNEIMLRKSKILEIIKEELPKIYISEIH